MIRNDRQKSCLDMSNYGGLAALWPMVSAVESQVQTFLSVTLFNPRSRVNVFL